MILQALNDYYHRKSANDPDALAPEGFERKEIPFVIVIDRNGNFVDLQDTREKDKKGKLRAKTFLVPQSLVKAAGIKANLLWDNCEYVLGISLRKDNPEKVAERHRAFRTLLTQTFGNYPNDQGVSAVLAFFRDEKNPQQVIKHPIWKNVEALQTGNFTFRLDEDVTIIAERSSIQQFVAKNSANEDERKEGVCLITGRKEPITRVHPKIKGVKDAQPMGASIVSFNERAYESYGYKEMQGLNAPIGESAAFAYTTALNTLLGKDSRQRIQVGDASTVFWAEKTHPLEDSMADFLNEPQKDDPDRQALAVKALYDAPWSGNKPAADRETRFYILGLAPNASRISVRFWHVATVAEVSGHILQHFEDTKICHADFQKPCLSLFRLLSSIAVQEKSENIPPNLAGDTMKAILGGTPYPATLLQAAIRRNRAAQDVSYPRASLIKACLNRTDRFYNKDERELTMALDLQNKGIAYNLGRLFAVYEKVQYRAIKTKTVKNYFGSASSSPASVFPTLARLNKHHINTLERDAKGAFLFYKDLQENIYANLEKAPFFPNILSLREQGDFSVGYYHQTHAIRYDPKAKDIDPETTEEKEAA